MCECHGSFAEYGTTGNLRFLPPEDSKMYDGDGNIMLCQCGKPAGGGIFGNESFQLFCSDCNATPDYSAEFIYKPPKIEP